MKVFDYEELEVDIDCLHNFTFIVRGVLRNRGWKVGAVTEFYPKNANLLGLNVNRGHLIKIRLRTAHK